MTGTYRDYELGSLRRPRRRRWRGLLALLLLGALAFLGWHKLVRPYRALDQARRLVRERSLDRAARLYRSLEREPPFRAAALDGLGVTALLAGDLDEARRRFAAAGDGRSRFAAVDFEALVLELLDRGDYPRAEVLAGHARRRQPSETLQLYHGLALNGIDDLAAAREAMGGGVLRTAFERVRRGDEILLGGVLGDERIHRLYASHVKSLVDKQRSGRRPYLFDAAGKPLAQVLLKSGETDAGGAAERAAVLGPDGKGGIDRYLTDLDRRNRVATTIEPDLQRAAFSALRGRVGALAVLDLDGQVLAATARDDRGKVRRRGADPVGEVPDPFHTLFDTASVAKVPTLAAALADDAVLASLFPFTCRGPRKWGGETFYCWRSHGQVAGVDQALAVSCNLAFAEIGSRLGGERLLGAFRGLGFDRAAGEGVVPDRLATVAGELDGDAAVARLAIGLDLARSSAVGAAAIALAVASGGEWREPFVVREKSTIGGNVYSRPKPARVRAMSEGAARRLGRAMERVMLDPEGTGRRAEGGYLTIAGKTGTAGGGRDGYRVLFAGYAPAEAPRYAFAVLLLDRDRAEWSAVFVARALVDGLHAVEEEWSRRRRPW